MERINQLKNLKHYNLRKFADLSKFSKASDGNFIASYFKKYNVYKILKEIPSPKGVVVTEELNINDINFLLSAPIMFLFIQNLIRESQESIEELRCIINENEKLENDKLKLQNEKIKLKTELKILKRLLRK